MPYEILDEPTERGSATRSAPASAGGYDIVEDQPKGGFDFVDEKVAAPDDDEIINRVGDVNYDPSPAEFQFFKEAKARRPLSVSRMAGTALAAGQQVAADLGTAAKKLITDPLLLRPREGLQTGAEAVARGTYDLGMVARKMQPLAGAIGVPGAQSTVSEAQFLAGKTAGLNEKAFPGGMQPGVTQWFGLDVPVPKPLMEQWRKEFKEYRNDIEYQDFLEERVIERHRMSAREGKSTLVPEVIGKADTDIAEGASYIADPATLITLGAGAAPKAAVMLGAKAAGATVQGAGRAAAVTGEAVARVAAIPERLAGRIVVAVTDSADAAASAEKAVRGGTIAATAGIPLGLTVPGLSETAAAVVAGKAAGATMKAAGEGAEAVGRELATGPSRYGLLERLSKDASSPQWLRTAAGAARSLDPALRNLGTAARGAAEGAAVGGTLGAIADGEEGFAAGLGSGGVLGAGGALVNRWFTGGARKTQLEDADLARWMASKSPDEIANLQSLNLPRESALKMLDTERFVRGVGDVDVRYVRDAEFRKLFGGIAKGAQVIDGDRPIVFINTDFKGARPLFHETLHALDALEGFTKQRAQLNRILFDQSVGRDSVGRDSVEPFSRGLYSADDLKTFESQYRARLAAAQRAQWDALDAESRALKIQSEVRAESFANLIAGARSDFFLRNTLGRRVADSLLLAESASFLGRMRSRLERLGVKFDSQGKPSEVFVRAGQPITNSAEVNAALRDYVRAKQGITRRLTVSDDESPAVVVRPFDLQKKGSGAVVNAFKDNDIFARNPDGTVKMLGGIPVLLTEKEINLLQSKRVEQMTDALGRVADDGAPRSMRRNENGSWTGKHFNDAQLAALRALPDDILSPSMKEKLAQLNELFQRGDGSQILLDYNAALKGRKYSSGISSSVRAAVPLDVNISKAGNFYVTTLDTSHFYRKLGEWRRSKPKAFEPWQGDTEAFLRDTFKYLDNHARGLSGSVGLDADPIVAVDKKHRINDFFNVHKKSDVNPVQLSSQGGRDNLIRSRRFDRINRVAEGAGDKFPIDYQLQQANFLPENIELRSGSPAEVMNHYRSETHASIGEALAGAGVNRTFAGTLADVWFDQAIKHLPQDRLIERAAIAPRLLRPDRLQTIVEAYRTAGENGARSSLEEQARISALEYKLREVSGFELTR